MIKLPNFKRAWLVVIVKLSIYIFLAALCGWVCYAAFGSGVAATIGGVVGLLAGDVVNSTFFPRKS